VNVGPSTTKPPRRPASGEHEQRLAVGGLAQQISQAVGVLTALVAITFVARRLSLPEFGTYGLLVSLTAYVLFFQASVETAAVKAIAEAPDQMARDEAFSTAMTIYSVAGLIASAVLATGGTLLLEVFDIPATLDHQARLGVLSLAALTFISWPFKVFQDLLRGTQAFVSSACAEIVSYVIVAALLVGLVTVDAELWYLVAAGASGPLIVGVTSGCIVFARKLPYRFRRADVTLTAVRAFVRLASYLSLVGLSGLVIYSMDRAILAAFRSTTVVGLYEGPVRAHNFVQQVHSTLTTPVLPAAASYVAKGEDQRARDLLLRGTRYTLAVVVPLAIVFMALAQPILEVWLGPEFSVADTAMTVLVAYWLFGANVGVAANMLVAAGRVRQVTIYASGVALLNLVLSLLLTPLLGLNGVVLGTTLAYVLGIPFLFAIALSTFHVSLSDFAREAWLPAYLTGAVFGALLLVLRLSVNLDSLGRVAAAGGVAVVGYWAVYYVAWLRPSERLLVKNVAAAIVRR
jgi:O-antigen/teichoic acid export membrane protein